MNDCDRIRRQLSARIDGELSSHESREVDDHLQACTACRQELETLTEVDNRLEKALTVQNVDDKVTQILLRAGTKRTVAPRVNAAHAWRFVAVGFLGIAATILIAIVPLLFENESPQPQLPSLNLIAQVTRATGPVQFLAAGKSDWSKVIPDARTSIAAGSRLKTEAGVLCEIETISKGVLRLNESAEVVFVEANRIELISGKIWCLTPDSSSIEVVVPESNQQTVAPLVFACPSSTELQCAAGERSAWCDSVSQKNATATMTMGAVTCSVSPAKMVSIDQEQKIDRTLSVDMTSKIWQLPLLAVGAEVDKELVSLLDRLLVPVGMSKARSLNEEQLRMLGPAGAIPLLAYASAENSPEHLHLRRTAIRLASELVDQRGVRLLKVLTSDPDEYIAGVAKETLNRIESTRP